MARTYDDDDGRVIAVMSCVESLVKQVDPTIAGTFYEDLSCYGREV